MSDTQGKVSPGLSLLWGLVIRHPPQTFKLNRITYNLVSLYLATCIYNHDRIHMMNSPANLVLVNDKFNSRLKPVIWSSACGKWAIGQSGENDDVDHHL
jgi:hypothetical protein